MILSNIRRHDYSWKMIRSVPRRGVQNKDWFSDTRQKEEKKKSELEPRNKARLVKDDLVMTLTTLSYMAF